MSIKLTEDVRFSLDGLNVISLKEGDVIENPSEQELNFIGERYEACEESIEADEADDEAEVEKVTADSIVFDLKK